MRIDCDEEFHFVEVAVSQLSVTKSASPSSLGLAEIVAAQAKGIGYFVSEKHSMKDLEAPLSAYTFAQLGSC